MFTTDTFQITACNNAQVGAHSSGPYKTTADSYSRGWGIVSCEPGTIHSSVNYHIIRTLEEKELFQLLKKAAEDLKLL